MSLTTNPLIEDDDKCLQVVPKFIDQMLICYTLINTESRSRCQTGLDDLGSEVRWKIRSYIFVKLFNTNT